MLAIGRAEEALRARGRVFLRYSGTEPLLRILVEGPEAAEVKAIADELEATVREALAARRVKGVRAVLFDAGGTLIHMDGERVSRRGRARPRHRALSPRRGRGVRRRAPPRARQPRVDRRGAGAAVLRHAAGGPGVRGAGRPPGRGRARRRRARAARTSGPAGRTAPPRPWPPCSSAATAWRSSRTPTGGSAACSRTRASGRCSSSSWIPPRSASRSPTRGSSTRRPRASSSSPPACAYVGDIYEIDVVGAAGAGLVPVLIGDGPAPEGVLRVPNLRALTPLFPGFA